VWYRPSVTVIGIDGPDVARASNTLPPCARAKFSLRVPPGQDPRAAYRALVAHLEANVPWGARLSVELGEIASPWVGQVDGPVYDLARWALQQAWGTECVHMGVGGTIPFIAALQAVYPDAVVLVTGVEDPDTRAHGANESLHLGEFERAALAETLLLAALATGGSPSRPPGGLSADR
jgi:acetylornithine deacetylase/succinyl-diaminopimelate desuccinylase-like protein